LDGLAFLTSAIRANSPAARLARQRAFEAARGIDVANARLDLAQRQSRFAVAISSRL
jgi:hypothetical protein